ncbi:uncharacterized protein LOC118195101 [Stegodyphus dumicola]|uniref:uncharacterized protein LOC118195101 n=1 Tax=Stegodyphus dumicola TaxID=202533 RepID=UPI0015AA5000|nr:uncharacterized protein LOC118195101 [Stegodyphus dumicola]
MSAKRTYSASNVLLEDPDFPFWDSDDDLIDEVDQIFLENPMDLPLYYQVGSGFETSPSSARGSVFMAGSDERSIDEAIVLEEKSRRRNHKYQAEEITFRASIDMERLPQNVQRIPMVRIPDTVRELFEQLIRRTTTNLGPSDLIRFCIQAEGLDKPISTSLMTVSTLTVEKILAAVMKVMQSKDKIELDSGFAVDVITIRRPVGAGGNRRVINISIDRLRKQSILSIPYDEEGLCCAKAIVYALGTFEKRYECHQCHEKSQSASSCEQGKELHVAANVPLGPCTFTEIARFEEHLDTQIAVFSSENLNQASPNDAQTVTVSADPMPVMQHTKPSLETKSFHFAIRYTSAGTAAK